jgi:hypothetical protein
MILKVLQEQYSTEVVNHVVIIKPENFWQKQRASVTASKYKFEVLLLIIDSFLLSRLKFSIEIIAGNKYFNRCTL